MLCKLFLKTLKKNARTPYALDIAEIYLIIISLCFTFAEPFDDIFSLRQVVHWSAEIQTQVYDLWKEGLTD